MSISRGTSEFPEKVTAEDLSGLPQNKRFPSYGGSMDGGNATSERPVFGAQGSMSEGYKLVSETARHDFGDPTTPTDFPGPSDESHVGTDETGSGYTPKPHTWKEI